MGAPAIRAALVAVSLVLAGGTAAAQPSVAVPATADTPALQFHVGNSELLGAAYPDLDPSRLAEDAEWTQDHARPVLEWAEAQGSFYLQRLSDLAGLDWPYRDIAVHLVRAWPTVSIEYPLTLALGEVRVGQQRVEVPDDDDVQRLLLAHQVAHYLLDDPSFLPAARRDRAYAHPFLAPGNFEVEAMVNWLTYSVLEELWGSERLREATDDPLWRSYNPNHEYVVDELMPRDRLSRTRTLADWLAAHPEGSEIFRVREAYARAAGTPEAAAALPQEAVTGTDYGLDLGATFEGRVFVSYVDRGSPAALVGLQQGDVLATVEGRPEGDDVVDVQRAMTETWERDGEIDLSVLREGEEHFFTIRRR